MPELFRYSGQEWPYPVEYGQELRDEADVLVIGGGLSGGFAAIHAAKRGAKVIVLEKGATVRAGAAGAGIDHWSFCFSNPCCKKTPEFMMSIADFIDPFGSAHNMYITTKEGYEALCDLEEWGVKVRDVDDEFVGAPFRDDETKLLFAYDYENRYAIRIWGENIKPCMYKEMKRLGIKIYDRTMATSLLTKDGKQGEEVIGATAINTRTGKFGVFRAKATVLATAKPLRLWEWGSETTGANAAHDDPNCAGDGDVMAFRAGAKLMTMERSTLTAGALRYPAYGTGNSENTWYPATMVDATGKEIPWTNRDDKILETVDERSQLAPNQEFMLGGGMPGFYPIATPHLTKHLAEGVLDGTYKQPFFADLTELPWYERKAIFGLHIGNEGKTRVPLYENLTRHGFDPEKDMLMANVTHPIIAGKGMCGWMGFADGVTESSRRETSFFNYGGCVVDWKHMTTLPSLFAVGNNVGGAEGASTAAANGRYCGRNLAKYVKDRELIDVDEEQIAREKARVYAPLANEKGYGWREVQIGLCRCMQDYLGEYKGDDILKTGLWWLDSIRKTELAQTKINNPRELTKWLETDVRLTVGEIIMHNSLSRKGSCPLINFKRADYPNMVNDGIYGLHMENNEVVYDKIPFKFWNANGKTLAENYAENCCRDEEDA